MYKKKKHIFPVIHDIVISAFLHQDLHNCGWFWGFTPWRDDML